MAELADAPDLGSGVPDVKVRALSGAPNKNNPNILPIGETFGFVFSDAPVSKLTIASNFYYHPLSFSYLFCSIHEILIASSDCSL